MSIKALKWDLQYVAKNNNEYIFLSNTKNFHLRYYKETVHTKYFYTQLNVYKKLYWIQHHT